SLSRLLQILRVIKRYGLQDLLYGLSLSPAARVTSKLLFGKPSKQSLAEASSIRIRKALEELGPVFIKLGQALSTRPDLLPIDVALELSKLQDQVPPFSGEQAIAIIKDCYGDDYEEIFATVDAEPMASASVAQVHAATLNPGLAIEGKNGKKTAEIIIKVLRPDIEKVIDSDLRVMHTIAGILQKHWSRGNQFKPVEVIKEYDNTIHGELDLRLEAANCSQMAANFGDSDLIYVPQIYWDYCHQDVLVMERIYGTSIREFDTLRASGIDMEQLANDGVEVFFKQAFEDNFFHADMHPGNIFVSDEGRWIAVDFGIMGTLTDKDKSYLAEMLLGFFNRDYRAIAEAHLRAEWIPAGTRLAEFESAIRMVCEPNFAKPISEISFGKVLLQLFQTVRKFEIPVQPQLVLLYKTLLNIEGLGRQLHPQLNLWDTAKPFLEEWMKKQLSPQTLIEEFKRDWPRWRTVFPKILNSLENIDQQSIPESLDQKNEISKEAKRQVYKNTGIGIAAASAGIMLFEKSGILQNANLVSIVPWIGVVGLIWFLLNTHK
ncbi:MAG: ubiquinone biosynthesis regulatory protein kinase UbiB, partial [Acidiferrobacterales bacterium]|nr:ubiquinone biosynthesis regulatory protein kinase UbiB [Acidiferrobacterales bacterium]